MANAKYITNEYPVEVGLVEGGVPARDHRLHVLLPQPHRLLVGEGVERGPAVVASHPTVPCFVNLCLLLLCTKYRNRDTILDQR